MSKLESTISNYSFKPNNNIPSFFSESDWGSFFKYLTKVFASPADLLTSSYVVGTSMAEPSNNPVDIILTSFASIQAYLPNVLAVTALVILFGHLYSKTNSVELLNTITRVVSRVWLVGLIYYIIYILLHWVFVSNNLDTVGNIYITYLRSNEVYYSHVVGLAFLLVLAGIHLFTNSLVSTSTQISPEVPILTYLVASFGWVLLDINNFALFLVCLEGFSLTLYILATTGRLYGGVSAAIKYFVFGTLGSILLYWGAISAFELTADMDVLTLSETFNQSVENSEVGSIYSKTMLAQTMILLGFLIKLGAAPLHQWVADVYAGVPLFVTAFYAIFVKLALFVLFLKFAASFVSAKEIEFAALLSLIVGCFGTLRQVDIKRFLAYGSIAHTGYLLMGDLSATYVYLATYILASFVFFSVLLNTTINGREFIYISDLRFIGQSTNLMDRTILVVVLASMAGLPPFAGFYGKMMVWTSLMEDIYMFNDMWSYVLLLTNLLTSLVMMFYYMQVMCTLYVNDETVEFNAVTTGNANNIMVTGVQYAGLVLLTLWTFVMPAFLTATDSLI